MPFIGHLQKVCRFNKRSTKYEAGQNADFVR